MFEYRARCTNVVDGDTIDVTVDLGLRMFTNQRVRVFGIDTPERGRPGGAEATAYTRAFCQPATTVEWPLTIRTVQPHDKYGRWLADVWSDSLNLSAELLARNLATPYNP